MSRNFTLLFTSWLLSGSALVAFDNPPAALTFVFVILGWMVALVVHEFSHAFVAWKAGDHTIATKGYLSLDPLRYADVGTSIVFPVIVLMLGGLALPGGAVYLREDLMRSPAWRSASSLAGPLGTLAVLIVLAIVLAFGRSSGWQGPLWPAVAVLALFQAMAFVFNLLPVPGLDGYGVIRPFLPDNVRRAVEPAERWAIFVLVGVLFFVPGAADPLFGAAFSLTELVGINGRLIIDGFDTFRFWT